MFTSLKELPQRIDKRRYKDLGWNWMPSIDNGRYIQNEVVVLSEQEMLDYYKATNDLYDMFVKAGEWVVKNNAYSQLGIPPNMISMIEHTWEHDNNFHLYGRFDLTGGIDGKPIKLIEFNADTATSIPETAIVQWAHILTNDELEERQFNNVYSALVDNFKRIISLNPKLDSNLLLTYMESEEDETNVEILASAAKDAGFNVEIRMLPELIFDEKSVWVNYGNDQYTKFPFWFRLYPWEFLAEEEPDLIKQLTHLVTNDKLVILNPPYSLLFQSKGILKVLWDLFPNHPLLLETDTEPLLGKKQVEKVFFGREGANVNLLDRLGQTLEVRPGEYSDQKKVYQEFVEFPVDKDGYEYQAGTFFSYECSGIAFRREKGVIGDRSEFLGHLVDI